MTLQPRVNPLTCIISSHPIPSPTPLLLLLPLALLPAAKGTADIPASALDARPDRAGDALPALGGTANSVTGRLAAGDRRRHVAALVVLALALGAVDTLLGGLVGDGLEEAALAELAGG